MTNQEFFTGSSSYYNPTTYNASSGVGVGYQAPQVTGQSPATSNIFGLDDATVNRLFGGTNAEGVTTTGVVPGLVGAGNALAQSWLGFQQLGQAKELLAFQKDAFAKNFAMQEDAYNTAKTNQVNTAAKQNA